MLPRPSSMTCPETNTCPLASTSRWRTEGRRTAFALVDLQPGGDAVRRSRPSIRRDWRTHRSRGGVLEDAAAGDEEEPCGDRIGSTVLSRPQVGHARAALLARGVQIEQRRDGPCDSNVVGRRKRDDQLLGARVDPERFARDRGLRAAPASPRASRRDAFGLRESPARVRSGASTHRPLRTPPRRRRSSRAVHGSLPRGRGRARRARFRAWGVPRTASRRSA